MTTYTPDRWVITKLQKVGEEPYYRILAGWYGGFTTGDSWKLSSGVEKVVEHEKCYEFFQASGSIYICYKNSRGMSMYMMSVFGSLKESGETNGILFDLVDDAIMPLAVEIAKPVKEAKKLTKAELKELGLLRMPSPRKQKKLNF